ncbi:hypothetical protein RIF29_39209 [Crotalaria pallida]|uniref:Uncharacterized protein n=1 Tax=Crotalaria pallida TaxID=3830 RepID=A0AAN9E3T4_CROPI
MSHFFFLLLTLLLLLHNPYSSARVVIPSRKRIDVGAVEASSDSCVFKVRSICDDLNIMSMDELPGANLSLAKAFPSSYVIPIAEYVPGITSEVEETSTFVSDLIVTLVSLGDDDNVVSLASSSVKRKLEPEFVDNPALSCFAKKKRMSKASKKVVV